MAEVLITRDDRWMNYYNQGLKVPDTDPETYANIFWKTEQLCNRLKDRKVSRGVKFISWDKCPKEKTEMRKMTSSGVKCQAITMMGKPCPFRATSGCGKFCKKHIIVE